MNNTKQWYPFGSVAGILREFETHGYPIRIELLTTDLRTGKRISPCWRIQIMDGDLGWTELDKSESLPDALEQAVTKARRMYEQR